jgi:DNA-binding HxlR family transcriptional regulator
MPLPRDYPGENCALARTLEVVGERWTFLVLRDAFYGVRRFGDFANHLRIPRPVLSERLGRLCLHGLIVRRPGDDLHEVYELTDKGRALWPALRELIGWGDEYYSPDGLRRLFVHVADDGLVGGDSCCEVCGDSVPASQTVVLPGPALESTEPREELVTLALRQPHRLLEPVR